MKDFKKLRIWEMGMAIATSSYEICEHLPQSEKFGLRSQITRSAVSIPSNIAEGHSRSSDKEKARLMEMAIGSTFELDTQLILISELGFVPNEKVVSLLEKVAEEQIMIAALIRRMKQSDN